jgi:hypothetical protein
LLRSFKLWLTAAFLAQILINVSAESVPGRRIPDRISEGGTLRWRGKPFFPIGVYNVNQNPGEYRLLAENGFNMIQGMFPGDPFAFVQSLNAALAAGIAVDVPLYISEKVKANLANSLSTIKAARHHPAVLCWKILDEPEANRNASVRNEVPGTFSTLKAVFPEQAFELTLCQAETMSYWSKFCDIVQIDRYPVPDKPLTDVYDFCRKAAAAKAPWQTLIFVLQCGWTPDLKTQPSFDQARAMVYLALIGGAKGISWYSRQEIDESRHKRTWDLTTSPLWPRMKQINREVQSLAPPILLGEEVAGIKSSAPAVYVSCRSWQEKLYLLVCNPSDRPVETALSLPDGIHLESVRGTGVKGHYSTDGASIRMLLEPIDSGTLVAEIEKDPGSQFQERHPITKDHPSSRFSSSSFSTAVPVALR